MSTDPLAKLLGFAPLGVISALFAASTGIYAWHGLDSHRPDACIFVTCSTASGGGIHAAFYVVVLGGLAGSVWLVVARNRPRLLAASLLVGAAALGLALGLVALDSATYVQRSGPLFGRPPETAADHLGYLYLYWGAPLAVLALQAAHAWLRAGAAPDPDKASLGHELRRVLGAMGVLAGFALAGALICGLVGAAIGDATASSCDPNTEMLCGLEGAADAVLGAGVGLLLGLLAGSLFLWRGMRRRAR